MTHENADFDAVASLVAAELLYPGAVPVLPRRVNRNVREFLALYGAELPLARPDDLPRGRIRRAILVDTQSLTMLRGMDPDLLVHVIDHHELDQDLPPLWTVTGELLGATTTILVEAITARGLRLSQVQATLFLLGLYEDTGSLSYLATSGRDVRAAAWLLDEGANLEVANQFLHHPLVAAQRELYEHLLSCSESLEIEGHTIVVAAAEAPGFDDEISTLAHKLRELLEPSGLFVLVDLGSQIQLVARSTTDDVDVSIVARHFGGGGHRRAAAALIRGHPLEWAREELLRLLPTLVRPTLTVAQVMSRGVQVLSPSDLISDAARRMRRTGHEGYPVVEHGRVVGLLTRRAVDRATQFGMSELPVTRVMEAGDATVRAADSVKLLQQRMIESGWGQIPVMQDDRLVGVATRTDLISLWGGASRRASEHRNVGVLLESALSEPALSLVRRISDTANAMVCVPYLVAGLVRDLLLGSAIFDIDMVIEGDAIQLAQRLASEFGGHVRTHGQFGTAHWTLSEEVWSHMDGYRSGDDVPDGIDLVTARTEFYTHPTALPEVASSSIKQDLHRRDFTVNTMAIRLDPDHWGELLDFYGGQPDLNSSTIRVLHSLSFVDDPTRMLRGARFEARLGFSMDARTSELIAGALPLLDRVSGGRIRHELALIFREYEPERALCRLDELQVLGHIDEALVCDDWLKHRYRAIRMDLNPAVWSLADTDTFFLHLGLLACRLESQTIERLSQRLQLARDDADDLRLLRDLVTSLPVEGIDRPSKLVHLLRTCPTRVVAAAWLAVDPGVLRGQLISYQTTWHSVRAQTTGDDLVAIGLRPGPLFGEILRALLNARLDGVVTTDREESALLHVLLRTKTGEAAHLARKRGGRRRKGA